jgi:transposase-like protein
MPVMKRQELRKLIEENNLKNIDDIETLLGQLEKEMIEEVLQGKIGEHLGYSKYGYEDKNTDNPRKRKGQKDISGIGLKSDQIYTVLKLFCT